MERIATDARLKKVELRECCVFEERINSEKGWMNFRIGKVKLKRRVRFGRGAQEETRLPMCSGLITSQVIKDRRRPEEREQVEGQS